MKHLAALLLLLPLNASAGMILEYWGTVDWANSGAVSGEAVSGVLAIETGPVPDWHPDPNVGNYFWNNPACWGCPRVNGPSFVNDGSGVAGESDDHLWADRGTEGWDFFGVEDTEYGSDRTFTRIELSSPVAFLTGPQMEQAFDVDVAANGGSAFLTVSSLISGVQRFFGATLERVRLLGGQSMLRTCASSS